MPGFWLCEPTARLSSGVILLLSSSSISSILRFARVPKLRDLAKYIMVADFAIRNWKYLGFWEIHRLSMAANGASPATANGALTTISENNTRSEIRSRLPSEEFCVPELNRI